VAADQASKWFVRRQATDLPFDLGWGFRLQLVSNRGISFGRLTDSGGLVLVAVAALVVGLALGLVLGPPRYRLGLGVLLGGALGNLIDRVRFGAVVDFVQVPWWPTFNVADAAIVAGVALVVWQVLHAERT
jgi:signal peptidase II